MWVEMETKEDEGRETGGKGDEGGDAVRVALAQVCCCLLSDKRGRNQPGGQLWVGVASAYCSQQAQAQQDLGLP